MTVENKLLRMLFNFGSHKPLFNLVSYTSDLRGHVNPPFDDRHPRHTTDSSEVPPIFLVLNVRSSPHSIRVSIDAIFSPTQGDPDILSEFLVLPVIFTRIVRNTQLSLQSSSVTETLLTVV